MIFSGCIEIYLYKLNNGYTWNNLTVVKFLMAGLDTSIENAGILLGLFLGKKFYDAQLDIQKGEQAMRENELRLLKSQIDPHFLFNNLNTVDSMIDSNPALAKKYLNRLAKLYRYLITIKDYEVVPLEDELNFAKDYIFLIEQRFGDAYKFDIENNTDQSDLLIPPASLQTILENVVKHNIGDKNKAIIAKIKIDNDNIIISNNIHLKKDQKYSNGTGLKNLIARYELLTEQPVTINSTDQYTISLPMLKSVD
jgi:LytS/YehU family sensor histidine kinase